MKTICVVTGGGSGMGFEAAKLMGKVHKVILCGRTVSKLESAINELHTLGIDAEAYPGDASDRESIKKLAAYAAAQGEVKAVIHAAGVSPTMAKAEKLFEINAIGTIIVDEEFSAVMGPGSCILNLSSSSGYMLPAAMLPTQVYPLSMTNVDAFRDAMKQVFEKIPEDRRDGMAYPFSKNFVIWYTERMAVKLGSKGIRVVSIAPGIIRTPLSDSEASSQAMAKGTPIGRIGEPDEIAKMMEFIINDTYLNGVDILYDGGLIAGMHAKADNAKQQ